MSNRNYNKRHDNRIAKRRNNNCEYDNFDKVFTYDNLLASAFICKRSVNWKASVQNFMREVYFNVYKIYDELHKGKFQVKCTYEFDTYERGKRRHIRSVHIRERVVQRCLCDYCLLPILEKTFIYDNCASLKGKGITFAINRVVAHLQKHYRQYGTEGYALLFDFSDFFGSINHNMIMEQVKQYITDERLLHLIYAFIKMYKGDIGLGLGSQISQTLALLAVSPIDHLIKDKYQVKHYVRYMDDGIIIHNDKAFLDFLLTEIEKKSAELGLTINKNKTRIVKLDNGFTFIKKKISIEENGKINIRISRRSITRMRRKLKAMKNFHDKGLAEIEDIEKMYQSWRGLTLKYDTYKTVKSMDELYNRLFTEVTNDEIQNNSKPNHNCGA